MFTINRDTKEIIINFNLFLNFIEGVDKFNINSKQQAEPATHALIISMEMLFGKLIKIPFKETSKNKFNKK